MKVVYTVLANYTKMQNKLMLPRVEVGNGANWEIRIDIYTLLCIK